MHIDYLEPGCVDLLPPHPFPPLPSFSPSLLRARQGRVAIAATTCTLLPQEDRQQQEKCRVVQNYGLFVLLSPEKSSWDAFDNLLRLVATSEHPAAPVLGVHGAPHPQPALSSCWVGFYGAPSES